MRHAPGEAADFPAIDVALLGAGMYALIVLPRNTGGDGAVRFDTMRALLDGHIPHEKYSLVTPLLAAPLDVLGRAFGADVSWAYYLNDVVFGLGLLAIWLLVRRSASGALIRCFLLLLVFGSMFPASLVSMYGETVTAVFIAVGLLAVMAGRHRAVRGAGWCAAVLGAVNTPAVIPAFAAVVVFIAVRKRSPWPLAAAVAAVGLSLLDLRLHTGGFTSPYDNEHGFATVLPTSGRPGFSYPAVYGILAIVFSLGKGLLFYAPGMFVPVRDGLARALALARARWLWLIFVAGIVLVYCRWWAWYGGIFFGPRFFLVASFPAALAVAARLRSREQSPAVTLVVLALSLWVGFASAAGAPSDNVCIQDNYALEHLCWYTPEFSALWRPFTVWPRLSGDANAFGLLSLLVFVRLAVPKLIQLAPVARSRGRVLMRSLRTDEPW